MENLSHSFPKKAYNGNGFGDRTVYDDVFGGPPKFGVPSLSPRVDDYAEIFGSFYASRASSIPILDLPAIDEANFSVDVRCSHFDYSEVFGGFNALDFAVSFEELLNQSKTAYNSEEAWTPAQSESLSDESDPSASSERSQRLLNGGSYQSIDGIKQFDVSYNKASQRSEEDMSNAMGHTTQLHAVPGFDFVVKGTPPSQKTEDRNSTLLVTDLNSNVDFKGALKEGKQLRKTMSHSDSSSFCSQTLGTDMKPAIYGKAISCVNEAFLTVSDISLRTQPSQLPPPLRPPPILAVKDGDSDRQKSKLTASRSFALREMAGDSSPPFFDVEVDASSSAAVSAAAMKDVMEKAQAKLRSAKELMERKKDGPQSCIKLGFKNDTKDKKVNASKTFDGTNCFKAERMHETCQRDCSRMRTSFGEERQKVMKITQIVSDSIEGGKRTNVGKISPESYKTQGTVSWTQAAEYYEVVETDKSKNILQQAVDERVLVQTAELHEPGQEKKATPVFQWQEEDNREIKTDKDAREWDGNKGRLKQTKESIGQEMHEKKVKVNQEACKVEENGKKPRMAQQHGEAEKTPTEDHKIEECDNLAEVQQKDNELVVEKKLKVVTETIEDDETNKDAHEGEENERRLKETIERERYEKRLKEAIERVEIEKRLMEALDLQEKEKQQREACEREEKDKSLEEGRKREACEKRLKEALEQEENEKRLKEAHEREECEKRLKEALEQEENEKRLKEALEREETENILKMDFEQEEIEKKLKLEENGKKQKEAHEKGKSEEERNDASQREKNEKRLKDTWEHDENEKRFQEAYENEESKKRSKEAFKWKEIEKRSEEANECKESQKKIEVARYWEELKGWSKDNEQNERNENERKLKSDRGTFMHTGESFKASDGACQVVDYEDLQSACKLGVKCVKVKWYQGDLSFEKDGTVMAESIDGHVRVEAVEVGNVLFEEKFNSFGMVQDDLQHEKNQNGEKDATKSLHLHDAVTETVEASTDIGQSHLDRNKETFEISSYPGKPNVLSFEQGKKGTNSKVVKMAFEKEGTKDKFMSSQVLRESIANGRKMGADRSTVLEEKRNEHGTGQKVSTSQHIERKEKNLKDILAPKEREKEDRIKRERELEMDHLRNIEEEREREREREKDRMAVDRAILEARERAFVEARERAEKGSVERATTEVRQRAMAEARERLEKASAEARERSFAEKGLMDARIRSERASVERATAEAREHAFQKAMAEKATFEARERVERSVTDMPFASCKNGGMRQSSSFSDMQDVHCQGVGSSSGSIFSYSSVHGGVEGESAQRCKARLERHQRTAERAAKALAEKNMRDLLAQREQAERSRLAEVLDAEVKRWSSGKEGNLRALLSTLQYILGHDSGWQPIPLTEVITSSAVKKAYRKATLCVHPDKLQQRGASIHDKYVCEKVFDLLKEAWNKFNSEER